MAFWIVRNPPREMLGRLQETDRTNPFLGFAYAEARRETGARVVLFAEGEGREIQCGAVGYLTGRALFPSLDITCVPEPSNPVEFWDGVRSFCLKTRVMSVDIESFGARTARLPEWSGQEALRSRMEWRLPLTGDVEAGFSSNHRRSIKKAAAAGVTADQTIAPDAATIHAGLMAASMRRRSERGEAVPDITAEEVQRATSFLRSGAGRIFQARHGGEVVSSILVLMAPRGAYYQSAGTTPDGMAIGASVFLISQVIARLRSEGLELFNLSGADNTNPGLQRFKNSFGASPVELEAATYAMGSRAARKIRTALRLAVRDPARLRRKLIRVERSIVYVARPGEIPAEPMEGCQLTKLSDSDLIEAVRDEAEYSEQWERVKRLGFNGAFGLQVEGRVEHICWLIDHQLDARSEQRKVGLRAGEAEITHCITPTRYRGRGAYVRMIRALSEVAREQGISRLFMITSVENAASQRGIERAGLRRIGRIWHVWIWDRFSMIVRGHRFSRGWK